jgi:hypothetical protein
MRAVIYRLFGWWYRWQACKLAAQAIANRPNDERRLVHSYAVFFEKYMLDGADESAKFFGAEIVNLDSVERVAE